MKFYSLATLVVLFIALVQVQAKGFYCTKHIVIKHGDRCSMIYGGSEKAKGYHIRYKDLFWINPALDCDKLRTGDKICVDIDSQKSEKKNPLNTYVIKKGDTCQSIAKKLKTTTTILNNANLDLLLCNSIKQQVGVEIEYRKDGDYTPIYTNSKAIPIN